MCLTELTIRKEMVAQEGVGYKLVYKYYNPDKGRYEYHLGVIVGNHIPMKRRRWVKDPAPEDKKIAHTIIKHGKEKVVFSYPTGIHLFPTLEDVEKFRDYYGWWSAEVVKVKYRKVVATGYQSGCKVIVAREIMFLEEVSASEIMKARIAVRGG